MKKNVLIGAVIGLVLYLALFVGLGPIRRLGQSIVPDVLRNKVTVNSVCADENRIYVFQGDNGDFRIEIVKGGCPAQPTSTQPFQLTPPESTK